MTTSRGVRGFVLVMLILMSRPSTLQSAQECVGQGTPTNNNCLPCSTTVSLICESGDGLCEDCQYDSTAAIVCPIWMGLPPRVWAGDGPVACGAKIEARFNGCPPLGNLWGHIECECSLCGE